MAKKEKTLVYDEMIARLQRIVDALDSDETTLEQSIELYEEGITLLERCFSELRVAENRLQELRKRADGLFELVQRDESNFSPAQDAQA